MNIDKYYWLFSAAAQSIAALVAFIIAGVAIALSMMDRLVDQDDTLYEVVESLKKRQYKYLAVTVTLTGIAIVSSLISMYINPLQTVLRTVVMLFAGVIDFIVILMAIIFVINIIKPSKYSITAKREFDEAVERVAIKPFVLEPANVFFNEFIKLEKDIRAFLKGHDLYVPSRSAARMSFSFRQMIEALYQNDKISIELKNKLFEANKFRNLLFHGHIEKVDRNVIQKIRSVQDLWTFEKSKVRN